MAGPGIVTFLQPNAPNTRFADGLKKLAEGGFDANDKALLLTAFQQLAEKAAGSADGREALAAGLKKLAAYPELSKFMHEAQANGWQAK